MHCQDSPRPCIALRGRQGLEPWCMPSGRLSLSRPAGRRLAGTSLAVPGLAMTRLALPCVTAKGLNLSACQPAVPCLART